MTTERRTYTLRAALQRLDACDEAVTWVGDRDLATAWRECERGDWMLRLAAHVGVDRRLLVLAACDCAELAQEHWTAETAPACGAALTVARAWARGEATLEEVRAAASAAYTTYTASVSYAAAYAAAYAAYAAAHAADAAAYAASAAYTTYTTYTTYTAYTASAWAARAAAAAARAETLARAAELVRARISAEDVARALEV